MPRALKLGTGRDWSSWPVLLLLLTVLVPSGGVVWMMRAAMENDRLAVRQRLADAYRVQLETAKRNVAGEWEEQLKRLETASVGKVPAEAFASCVAAGKADSVLVLDPDGAIAYPGSTATATLPYDDLQWRQAERLEHAEGNPAAAAAAYGVIAAEGSDQQRTARAEQAQARCLLRGVQRDEAIRVLNGLRRREEATDASGRSLAADAELRLLEILERDAAVWIEVATRLRARLDRYEPPALPADQRRFLMHRLRELAPEAATFPTLAAEDLAAELIATEGTLPLESMSKGGGLQPTTIDGVWAAASPDGRLIALYRTATIESQLGRLAGEQLAPAGVVFEIRRPGESVDASEEWLAASLAPMLRGWRLDMGTTGEGLFDAAASERRALLAWVAGSLVAVTLAMAWLVASGLRRQMQVARLKNDLVATVSHELKTPLASIRLLVDTLLAEGSASDQGNMNGQRRDYLELIASENARLSRLIDNFLTFSRMDRGKHRFEFQLVDVREVIQRAAAAVEDRFDGVQAELVVDADGPPGKPDLRVRGDFDALVTATINLLDNAWKYTGEKKLVRLRAGRAADRVVIEVDDNGVGLTPWAARRVFDRFYQVDQRVSRSQGGCGLGLSIVRYIVEAHGGQASVESRPAAGCKFTLMLPADVGGDNRQESSAPASQASKETAS